MPDLPDWYQGFQLVGSDITINVNIEASGVTLPISIDAVTADLDVTIEAVDVTIDINFSGQAVAVFDAAKWFAHEAAQVFVTGFDTIADSLAGTVVDYTVPALKTFFLVGLSYSIIAGGNVPNACAGDLIVAATRAMALGSRAGTGLPLDTPVRATAGQHVYLELWQFGIAAGAVMWGSIWGYLEDA